eukprot:TRINITY_DN17286_c0_g1_i1.p1 TRINITY_DN17286_c0_g1~~TRINITY_DN17286_c0_g1_i1.p1  ORF type:complete len:407 (+),score=42.54 TRINITY_DN17286_c0_g1_i1:194-1414(+)
MSRVSKLLRILQNNQTPDAVAREAAMVLQRPDCVKAMDDDKRSIFISEIVRRGFACGEEHQVQLGKNLSGKSSAAVLCQVPPDNKTYTTLTTTLAKNIIHCRDPIPFSTDLITSMSRTSFITSNNWIQAYCSSAALTSFMKPMFFKLYFANHLAEVLVQHGVSSAPHKFVLAITKAFGRDRRVILECLRVLLVFPRTSSPAFEFVNMLVAGDKLTSSNRGRQVKITLRVLLLASRSRGAEMVCENLIKRLELDLQNSEDFLTASEIVNLMVESKSGGIFRSDVLHVLSRAIEKRCASHRKLNRDSKEQKCLSNTDIARASSVLVATQDSRRDFFLLLQSQLNFHSMKFDTLRTILLSFSSALVTHTTPLFAKARRSGCFKQKYLKNDKELQQAFDLARSNYPLSDI